MATGSIPTPSHQVLTNNHQQGQGQQPNQNPRASGQANNDQRVKGMQNSGMTFNRSQDPFLLFPPEPTGKRPPRSDITQYQDPLDRSINKPRASDRPTNNGASKTSNPAPNPAHIRYWVCCQNCCDESGGSDLYATCFFCDHQRCAHCPAGNARQTCDSRQ